MSSLKRSTERVAHSLPCSIISDYFEGVEAQLLNLSVDGMLIAAEMSADRLKSNDSIQVSFPFTSLSSNALMEDIDNGDEDAGLKTEDLVFQTRIKRIEEKQETLYLGLQVDQNTDLHDMDILEDCWLTLNFESRD